VTDVRAGDLMWRKSSHSEDTNCLEVAATSTGVLVRHSNDTAGQILSFSYDEWQAFVAGVRNNEFDFSSPPAAPLDL
jgi:predicted secreted Zn-dependent protease